MFERWFLGHPHSLGESYPTHLRTALGFAGRLFIASVACLIHALLPVLFPRTASRTVAKLNDRMDARGRRPSTIDIESTERTSSTMLRHDA